MENANMNSSLETEPFSLQIERFSGLSSEMAGLLQAIRQQTDKYALELREVQKAVRAGREELDALCEMEKSASALEARIEDLRIRKEALESEIAGQRRLWEEEKAAREAEAREYGAILEETRRREAEERKMLWESEQAGARQRLEAELETLRQRHRETLAGVEQEIRARESSIAKKEQEMGLLLQELEQFLSGLAGRIRKSAPAGAPASGAASAAVHGDPSAGGTSAADEGGFVAGNVPRRENGGPGQSAAGQGAGTAL